MTKKLKLGRRAFVKLSGALAAAATAGTLDLDGFAEEPEASPSPKARVPMEERIRKALRRVGIYPNENGVRDARLDPEMYKRGIMQCLDHLSPADLAAVGYVAACLQQPDVSPSPVEAVDSDSESELAKHGQEFREAYEQLAPEEQEIVMAVIRSGLTYKRARRS